MNILIIADDPGVTETVKRAVYLYEPSCTIFEASLPAEALHLMQSAHMNLVFSEIHMDKMNGLAFVEAHKNLFARNCWVAVSEFKSFYDIKKAIQLGGRDYLLKPVEEPVLQGLLEGLIHEEGAYGQGGYDFCAGCS